MAKHKSPLRTPIDTTREEPLCETSRSHAKSNNPEARENRRKAKSAENDRTMVVIRLTQASTTCTRSNHSNTAGSGAHKTMAV